MKSHMWCMGMNVTFAMWGIICWSPMCWCTTSPSWFLWSKAPYGWIWMGNSNARKWASSGYLDTNSYICPPYLLNKTQSFVRLEVSYLTLQEHLKSNYVSYMVFLWLWTIMCHILVYEILPILHHLPLINENIHNSNFWFVKKKHFINLHLTKPSSY